MSLLLSSRFPGTPEHVSVARQFAQAALAGDPRADAVTLALSEVATNAIEHTASGAGGTFTVMLDARPDAVHVEVTDCGGNGLPTLRHVNGTQVNGRGLALVQAVTAEWGYRRAGDRTQVWFTVT